MSVASELTLTIPCWQRFAMNRYKAPDPERLLTLCCRPSELNGGRAA